MFLPYNLKDSIEQKLCNYVGIDIESETLNRLKWVGIFDDVKTDLPDATPAQILQKLLVGKWALGPADKDMMAEFVIPLMSMNVVTGMRVRCQVMALFKV